MQPNTSCFFSKKFGNQSNSTNYSKFPIVGKFSLSNVFFEEGKVYAKECCGCDEKKEIIWEIIIKGFAVFIDIKENKCKNCSKIDYPKYPPTDLYYAIDDYIQAPNCQNCLNKFNYEIIGSCTEHYTPLDGITYNE